MTGKLVTMRGPKPQIDIRSLSDIEAGLMMLSIAAEKYPNLRVSQLAEVFPNHFKPIEQMGFLWGLDDFVGRQVKNATDATGDLINWGGGIAGDTVRLAADPQVTDLLARAGMAYATGGASEGLKGFLTSFGKGFTGMLGSLGSDAKGGLGAWIWPLAIGGGVILLYLLFGKSKKVA